MSEKRFKLSKYVTPSSVSNFCDENGKMLNKEVVKVLNEQQTTINKQLDQIIELQDKYRILEFNHSRLEKRNKAQYEKIGEQQTTISQLKEENEQLKEVLSEQQDTINKQKKRINELEQRDYDNQSERYKILGRAIELAANYIKDNNLEYCNFCGLVTEFENELLEGLNE